MISSWSTSISKTKSRSTPELRIASAWGMVRGKPSNRKPFLQSRCFSRSFTSPMMMSSETSCPASMTFFAARPSGVPAFTAARNMSPVEICGMRKCSLMKLAWVPLPAPGGPRRISLTKALRISEEHHSRGAGRYELRRPAVPKESVSLFSPGIAAKHLSDEMPLPFVTRAVKQRPHAFQVLGGIYARKRCILAHSYGDGVAVPKRAQLFKRLKLLKGRAFEPRIGTQEIGAVGIDADVPIARKPLRQIPRGSFEGIAGPGDRSPAEIARQTRMIENDLDDIGIEQFTQVPDRMAGCRHRRLRRICKQGRHSTYQPRFDHRLVALDVYDQTVRRKPESLDNLRDPIGAGGVVAAGHYGMMAVPLYSRCDVAVVGGYVHLARAAFARPLGYAHDHGLAPDIRERLPREPAGRETRRDDGGEGHAKDLRRPPPRSLAYFFLGGQLSRFLLEHHRNIVPNRKRESVGLADEFRLCPAVHQRSLANRADENVKQSRVHEFVPV